jgi:hypothetical protein
VRPLWVAVRQAEPGAAAELFEAAGPLDDAALAAAAAAGAPLAPFYLAPPAPGRAFSALADARAPGGWASFFLGAVGGVAAAEDEVLWPNQVLHRDRVLYNARGADDVARFLADARAEDVAAHAAHLARLAAERGYRPGWAGAMLRARWGGEALRRLGFARARPRCGGEARAAAAAGGPPPL